MPLWKAGRGIRPALAFAGVVALAAVGADAWRTRPEPSRGPIAVPDPAGASAAQLILDTLWPTRDVRLLWLDGRAAQPSSTGALVLDGAGGVLRIDQRLRARRVALALEGREPASIAPAADGGAWITDASGGLLRLGPDGAVLESRQTGFAYGAVAADPQGTSVWLVRSTERFAYALPAPSSPLLVRLGATGTDSALVGLVHLPAHVLLADLANSGSLAVGNGVVYYAPFIRDEVIAFGATGDTLWASRRGLPQSTQDPRFEVHDKRVVVNYHPVNLGIVLGPDGLLYVLSTAGFTMTEGRLDVFEPATGRLLRTARLATMLPTLAADSEGRVYLLDSFGLLTGVPPARREPIPEFDLPLLRGGRLGSAALRGRVALLNFWASWCAPCRSEMPALDSLRREVGDSGFVFLGINEEADTAAATAFLEEFGFDFPVLLGRGHMRERFHYPGLPYTLLVDREGRVVQRWIGFAGPEQLQAIRVLIRAELGRGVRHVHHGHAT